MHPYTHTHTRNGHSSHYALVPCWNARTLSDVMNWSWLGIGPRDLLCMILIRSSSWSPHGPNPCRNDFEEGTHKTSMWSPEICVHLDECKEWAFNRDLANPPADVNVASNSAFLKKKQKCVFEASFQPNRNMIEGPPKLILFSLDHGRPQITGGV